MHLPVISDATLPKAVVVVVAAYRTPFSAFLKNRAALTLARLSFSVPSLRVSVRSGMSLECWYNVTRILTAVFWSAILSIRHDQIRLYSLHFEVGNVQTCIRSLVELSGDELNGKLFQEKYQCTKEERKQESPEQSDDPLRVIAGLRRLLTIEKGLICDPDCYSPRGQRHISVQHLQPIDVAPATNGHKANRVSKDGWEKTTFERESTSLAHRCVDPIITRNTHENARQTHQPLRKRVRKGRTNCGKAGH